MAGETTTPNIGLQVPGFDQANWQVPTNYNWALLDKIFGGEVEVPALFVDMLTVGTFIIANFTAQFAAAFVSEVPAGTAPTTTYTCSFIPGVILAVYKNGVFQQPGLDYNMSGNQIVFVAATTTGDKVYVTYLH